MALERLAVVERPQKHSEDAWVRGGGFRLGFSPRKKQRQKLFDEMIENRVMQLKDAINEHETKS